MIHEYLDVIPKILKINRLGRNAKRTCDGSRYRPYRPRCGGNLQTRISWDAFENSTRGIKQYRIDQSEQRNLCSFYPDWSTRYYSSPRVRFLNAPLRRLDYSNQVARRGWVLPVCDRVRCLYNRLRCAR